MEVGWFLPGDLQHTETNTPQAGLVLEQTSGGGSGVPGGPHCPPSSPAFLLGHSKFGGSAVPTNLVAQLLISGS